MNIDDFKLGELKQIAAMFNAPKDGGFESGINKRFIGEICIIRTFSAGVWCGVVSEKEGNEVILTNARRMYRWWAAQSISLSAVAIHGIKRDKSRIAEAVPSVWLEAIEIIPVSAIASESIMGAENAKAE